MIISRTPFRISFFGGGTDYPAWYLQHGGAVLATTIDKYCYLTCRYLPPFFEHRFRIVYSQIENRQNLDEIRHPAVREGLRHVNLDRGVEIHHDGDLPARSGMGSSSAFTVGLLHALYALKGEMLGKDQLANESIYIEQEQLKEAVGSQDQVLAAYGGLNHISFFQNGKFSIVPITVRPERIQDLNSHLMLFYTGVKRTASDIARSYDLEGKQQQLCIMRDLVEKGILILNSESDITAFGELLHEAWQVKRTLSPKVSNSRVDELYNRARSVGAIGGKLTGAGGGGFMLLFVPPDRQEKVKEAFSKLIHVPIRFESSGSQIIFFNPEESYAAEAQARATQPSQVFQELAHL
ncbi:MAG: kinase [Candidatus Poribacteria bacterium]|nr:kinase [Candidatus Poribacteria bacterium]